VSKWEAKKPEEILSDLENVVEDIKKQSSLPPKQVISIFGVGFYERFKWALDKIGVKSEKN
jgi:hypothetical protein